MTITSPKYGEVSIEGTFAKVGEVEQKSFLT
ncbi:MAG: hypothetical protein ACJASX_001797 [Limisphaerales bacterium]|jgi:hypothetical protein